MAGRSLVSSFSFCHRSRSRCGDGCRQCRGWWASVTMVTKERCITHFDFALYPLFFDDDDDYDDDDDDNDDDDANDIEHTEHYSFQAKIHDRVKDHLDGWVSSHGQCPPVVLPEVLAVWRMPARHEAIGWKPTMSSTSCSHQGWGLTLGWYEMRVITVRVLDRLRTSMVLQFKGFGGNWWVTPCSHNFQQETSQLCSFPCLLLGCIDVFPQDQVPNLITYSSLLHGLASARRWSMAVMMLTALEWLLDEGSCKEMEDHLTKKLEKIRQKQKDPRRWWYVWESRIAFPFFCMSCKQVATTCFPPLGSRFHLVTSAANEASWHFAHRNRSGLIGTSIQFVNIEFWAVLKKLHIPGHSMETMIGNDR